MSPLQGTWRTFFIFTGGMMPVTAEDIKVMISGEPIPIDFPYPLSDRPAGTKWFMAQPDDWIYDWAVAIREAATAQAENSPEVKACRDLPPTASWVAQQNFIKQQTEERVRVLEAKGEALLPEEDLELKNQKDYLRRLIDPSSYTRADEIVNKRARKAFENWLMPRLLQDEAGKPLFEMDKPADQERWKCVGRDIKEALNTYFWQAVILVQSAKN
jgi:hypothetical protein